MADFIWREKVGSAAHTFVHLIKKTHFSCSRHHQQALGVSASEYELEPLEQIISWISITRSSSSLVRLDNSTSCQVSAVLQLNVCLNFSFKIVVVVAFFMYSSSNQKSQLFSHLPGLFHLLPTVLHLVSLRQTSLLSWKRSGGCNGTFGCGVG